MIPLIAAGIAAVGGVVGNILGNMGEAEAHRLIEQAMDATGKIDVPALEALVAEEVGPTALEGIKTDPRTRDAQYEMLSRMKEMYDGGGMDLEDRANLNRITSQAGRAGRAGANAIQGQMDARGMGGSSASWLLQQKATQDAAQNANQQGLDVAAQAMRRRFEAMRERGNMAGNIRGQEYGEQANLARARDEVSRYNAGARRAAGEYRNQMKQQDFANRMGKQGQMNQLAGARAGQASQQAANTQNMWAGIGDSAQGAINDYGEWREKRDERNRNKGGL